MVGIIVTILIVFVLVRLYKTYEGNFRFYVTGKDKGFSMSEISLLWKLAKKIELDEPSSLYISVPSLNNAIQAFTAQIKTEEGADTPENQEFLSTLYKYRTKIDIDRDNKKGLDTTRALSDGQKLRIILPGKGVFTSTIIANSNNIIVKLPIQKNLFMIPSEEWLGKDVNVYLWRKGDASYVFDTTVVNAGVYSGIPVLYLAETNKLLRTQKRKSVRCQCNLFAQMYFLSGEDIDFNVIENDPGFKCLLEDISEDGALIRIGGKAIEGLQLKIQFELGEKIIVMFGIARAIEYDDKANQSLIHFECLHLENDMRNHILSFVYNILPSEKKEVLEAISQTEEDEREENGFNQEEENNDTELFGAQPANIDTSGIVGLQENDFPTTESTMGAANAEAAQSTTGAPGMGTPAAAPGTLEKSAGQNGTTGNESIS
ncbi:MAG: PilZ domain-containing protein [Treponema sp.]|nr:PilZ domain-containing protein [Treponema sp.]